MEKSRSPNAGQHFMHGALHGALNGTIMMSILEGLMFGAKFFVAGLVPLPLITVALTVSALALFSGVMAVRRAYDGHGAHLASHRVVPQQDVGRGPVLQPEVAAESPAQEGPGWTEKTGRNGAQDRIQQILSDGSMSDKDRAAAILQARENGASRAL